jgi:hypothetical protein
MGLARFAAELCAYRTKINCAICMWYELLGVVNVFVSLIYGVQLRLKHK